METTVTAPIPGLVARVPVQEGDQVDAGKTVVVLNVMKTEIEVPTPSSGTVTKVMVKEWDEMQIGMPMVIVS